MNKMAQRKAKDKPTLTYFNYTGRAEPIRWLFKYGKIDFEDERFEVANWEATIKPTMPYGQAPVLDIDGKRLHQSKAIARYVAKLVNLVGEDAWQNAEIDAMVDTVYDVQEKVSHMAFLEHDEDKKAEMKTRLVTETIPYYWKKFDERAEANNGFIGVANKLTWADLYLVNHMEATRNLIEMKGFDEYPNLQKVKMNVINTPGIKEWLKIRAACPLFSYDLRLDILD